MTNDDTKGPAAPGAFGACFQDVPHVDEYFGVWAILEQPFRTAVNHVKAMDLRDHIMSHRDKAPEPNEAKAARVPMAASGSSSGGGAIAVIELTGPLMKHVSSLSGGTSTIRARRQLREAMRDPDVGAIMIKIDSPGGTVSGTHDLAEDITEAAGQMPVHAYIEDLGASAAYWLGSQAGRLTSGQTALVGSIGTFAVIHDLSGLAAMEGIKVHVLRAGAFKGAGEPGTEITAEQLAEWQRTVDELNEHFLAGVSAGRRMKMKQVRELADGRVHVGKEARALGLIDAVQSFDQAMADLRAKVGTGSRGKNRAAAQEVQIMDATNDGGQQAQDTPAGGGATALPVQTATMTTEQTVATLQELKTALPNADATFIVACMEKQYTLQQAQSAWMQKLEADNQTQAKELEQLKAAGGSPGTVPLATTFSGEAPPTSAGGVSQTKNEIEQLVGQKMALNMSRHDAWTAVMRERPDLRQQLLREHNTKHRRPIQQHLVKQAG